MRCFLIAVEVTQDEPGGSWFVTPYYKREIAGRTEIVSVPDDRGWDTFAEAQAEAEGLREAADEKDQRALVEAL